MSIGQPRVRSFGEILMANYALQRTFDPLPSFALAKPAIASNAAERGRYVLSASSGASRPSVLAVE